MTISRRQFLRNTAAVSAAAVTAVAPTVADATAQMTAEERFDFHLAEFKKAAEELDPRIGSWCVARLADADLRCSLAISAHRVTGRYEGDGKYESGALSALGRPTIYDVALLADRVDGHRMFSVRTSMDRMVLAEPRLNTFIGRRVS
ncbi:MAG: twin-arginine translocation signal domain-containing protein [Rhizobiaceae bacterium]|nr:twin-arginine translocation signal domain-containing protein [Rhizobiaceae bacterium]